MVDQGYEVRDGKRWGYYQAGSKGKRYYYTPNNEQARKTAKTRAERQQRAMMAGK